MIAGLKLAGPDQLPLIQLGNNRLVQAGFIFYYSK